MRDDNTCNYQGPYIFSKSLKKDHPLAMLLGEVKRLAFRLVSTSAGLSGVTLRGSLLNHTSQDDKMSYGQHSLYKA